MRFWKESTLASASALILAAAGFFTVSAGGCGGDDNGSQDTTDPEDVGAPEDTEPPAEVSFDLSGPDATPDGSPDSDEDTATAPGGFLAPCLENTDCNSGYCIETENGSVCTRNCESECPEDWRCAGIQSSTSDVTFLCMPLQSRLCLPCTTDLQCAGGYCLEDASGNRSCTRACGDGDTCPDGFTCEDRTSVEDESRVSRQCVPVTGICDCNARNAGEERPCPIQNEHGRCWGTQTCGGNTGWSECDARTPAPELCDGEDQNCNGIIDEGVVAPEEACERTNEAGTCQGAWSCAGVEGWSCEARAATEEVCNYLDDNCDGMADELYRDETTGLYVNDAHCGLCNNGCAGRVPFAAETACALENGVPACIAVSCQEGYFIPPETRQACVPVSSGGGTDCSPCFGEGSCGGLPGGSCERIDGSFHCARGCTDDVDCLDGFGCMEGHCVPVTGSCSCLDQNDGDVRTCRSSNEFGTCFALQTCDATTGWTSCEAPEPAAESCNGADDNCNGLNDEALSPPEEPCETVNDAGTCTGAWSCNGDAGWSCSARSATEEVCNYLDDNCDGTADEPYRDAESGLYVNDAHCGLCNSGCDGRIAFATATTCALEGGVPTCIATACEDGYFIPTETRQACVPVAGGSECSPCFGDLSCGGLPDGRCELLDGSLRCTRSCESEVDCQDGYACEEGRCRPVSGSCTCLASNAGNTRTCSNVNEFGACFASQTCDPTNGWSECLAATPAEEVCNGSDDNCNGAVDEGVVHDPLTCGETNEFGSCSAPWTCRGAAGWSCLERVPAAETCNYADDDCDGDIDEGFADADSGLYVNDLHCGACGISCVGALPNATAQCAIGPTGTPRCEVASCDDGYIQQGALACVPASADNCIPCTSDATCPGGACATLTDGTFCLNACTRDDNCLPGYSCTELDGRQLCIPDTRSCRCDGSDTNLLKGCSISYDDGGDGYSCFGTQNCTTTGWSECAIGGEECNLLDDDCDGETDEDFLVDGAFATDENCGQCGNDCTLLDFPGGGGICNTNVFPPRCSLQCSGNCFDLNANPTDGCECCDPTPEDFPDPAGVDANCDGIDGERDNAIFVAKWGSDANSGLWGAPKLTIDAGIAAAEELGKRDVYVATGVYKASVLLRRDVAVYGGYASDFADRDFGLFETAILGPEASPGRPAAVNAIDIRDGVPGGTVFDGFSVYGADVRTPGGSSFAVWVADSDASLRISNNSIFAGTGGKGQRGQDGADGADAPGGLDGLPAVDVVAFFQLGGTGDLTCRNALHTRAGGTPGVHTCGAAATSGGAGGNRLCPAWNDAISETTLPPASSAGNPGANGGASGGAAGRDVFHQRFSCEGYDTYGPVEGLDGADGAWGSNGDVGSGCADADGMVLDGVWRAGMASSGGAGANAGGGGGGGAGAGAYVHSSCYAKGLNYDNLGGTGGGGGAGGCAGTAGGPGTSGGGAFGIFVAFSTAPVSLPELVSNVISGGIGGDGGDGGNGGVGGSGGAGGFGGPGGGDYRPGEIVEPSYPAFKGGKGGKGGNGGHGGGGGGGCGGPSFGIYAAGVGGLDLSRWADDNAFPSVGQGGSGGLGGYSLGNSGGNGSSGQAGATNF